MKNFTAVCLVVIAGSWSGVQAQNRPGAFATVPVPGQVFQFLQRQLPRSRRRHQHPVVPRGQPFQLNRGSSSNNRSNCVSSPIRRPTH